MIQGTLFPECSHQNTETVLEKSGPHYARELCAECRKFLRWLPNPKTVEQQERNDKILTGLAKVPNLNDWERRFVREVVTHKHISPKQQGQLNLLRDKYLGFREEELHL